MDKRITDLKQELFEKYGIKTDRDLILQLGIKREEKDKLDRLFLWMNYQSAYERRAGYEEAEKEFKQKFKQILLKRHRESQTLMDSIEDEMTSMLLGEYEDVINNSNHIEELDNILENIQSVYPNFIGLTLLKNIIRLRKIEINS